MKKRMERNWDKGTDSIYLEGTKEKMNENKYSIYHYLTNPDLKSLEGSLEYKRTKAYHKS